jgi:hypothetical protein
LYESAINDYTEAIKINSKFAKAYMNRGSAKMNWGYYKQSLGQDPTKLYKSAINDYTEAIKINSKYAEAYDARGTAKMNWGLYKQTLGHDPTEFYKDAIEDFAKAIKINKKYASAYMRQGYTRLLQGKYKEHQTQDPTQDYKLALQDFEKAIELNPLSKRSLEMYIDDVKAFLKPTTWQGYFKKAILKMQSGKNNYKEAKALYEKGVKLLEEKLARKKEKSKKRYIKRYRKKIITAYYNLACCYAVVDKDKKKALDALEKAIEYGWSNYKHTIEDEDLKILHGEKRFKNLLNKMRSF